MGSFVIYTAPGGFTATAAGADTEQAKTRPLTFNGPAVPKGTDNADALRVGTIKHSPSEAQYAAFVAADTDAKRAAVLATMTRRVIKTGKVQVTTAALRDWQARTASKEAARAALSSGMIVLSAEREDETEDVLSGLFPDAAPVAE